MISGYRFMEELSRTERYVVFRAERAKDGMPFLLKMPPRYPPETSDVNLFTRE